MANVIRYDSAMPNTHLPVQGIYVLIPYLLPLSTLLLPSFIRWVSKEAEQLSRKDGWQEVNGIG